MEHVVISSGTIGISDVTLLMNSFYNSVYTFWKLSDDENVKLIILCSISPDNTSYMDISILKIVILRECLNVIIILSDINILI